MPPVWIVAAVTLATGVLFGMIEAGQLHWRDAWNNKPSTWTDAVWRSMPTWVLFGLLAPAAYVLTRHFRLDRHPRWPAAIVHVIAAMLFAVVHPFALASFYVISSAGEVPITLIIAKAQWNLIANFALDVGIYCAFAGAFHALLFYRDLRARELAASQLQTVLTQARLETLRAQLNPHFLFNTLNAISSLALKGEQQGVVQMLSLLSDLLRLSLDGHLPQEIALADELAFIDRYLELQRIRFSDRLQIGKAIDPLTLQARVPSLLLQPIVENAVLHGIAARRGPGRIDIRAAREGDRLLLEVTDTGPGFVESGSGNGSGNASASAGGNGSSAIGSGSGVDDGAGRDGVGLRNTRARLQHLYGDAQALSCRNLETGGAAVMIRIPFAPIAPIAAIPPIAPIGDRA
jgi:two-component system LytT family sensor kinase